MQIVDLCNEFIHIEETPEANLNETCVRCSKCRRKSVTCVVVLANACGETVFSKVYKNERFGKPAKHAEIFMIDDMQLRSHLEYTKSLTLYLTYQPCHFSGGHVSPSRFSCTNALIGFKKHVLDPLGIHTVVKFAYLYRAHWRNVDPVYNNMIQNSNIGLEMLCKHFDVYVMTQDDIKGLLTFCNDHVRHEWKEGLYDTLMIARQQLEIFMIDFLDRAKTRIRM